jgi:GTPase SAR1 family protein
VGYCRPRALPDDHHRVLPRRNGDFTRVRCHRRAVFQQYVSYLLFSSSLIIGVDIRTWHANIEQHASDGVNKILIGNKSDWTDKRAVSVEQGRELAEELDVKFIETSAKVNEGVEEAFFTLARCVIPLNSLNLFHLSIFVQ